MFNDIGDIVFGMKYTNWKWMQITSVQNTICLGIKMEIWNVMANVVGVMKNSNIEEQGGGSTEIEDLQIGPHWMKLMKGGVKNIKY